MTRTQRVRFASTPTKFRTVTDLEKELAAAGPRVSVFRLRRRDTTLEANPSTALSKGDVIALGGRRNAVMQAIAVVGPEQDDAALLNFPIDTANIFVTNGDMESSRWGS